MRVAIIGAGAAGLPSARHASENGFDFDVFEMNDRVGGTWVYTDDVGTDRYGFPIYTAMYKGLRTNLPKEVMGFPDFPFPEQQKSYLTQPEILHFLESYADHFKIRPMIKFNSLVTDVRPLADDKWQLSYIDKPSKKEHTKIYDAVMVCNGHYNDPVTPNIMGQELFAGKIEHSHTFRTPDAYEGKRILVVGAGPSGMDITLQLSKVAKHVVLSHHCKQVTSTAFPDSITKKPDVRRIVNGELIEFTDGTSCYFDSIIFCTGYHYSFPFLHESCGITVDQNFIQPLYKHLIHIDRPTMCFIGIPFKVCTFSLSDLQARYFCKYLDGSMRLPSSEEMRKHTNEEMQMRWKMGYTKRQAHMMGSSESHEVSYYKDLAEEANTTPIAPVLAKLRDLSLKNLYSDLLNFREDRYQIIDRDNFVKIH